MAYPYSRRRIPRTQPQQPDMTDANRDGYPDVFEAEEAQLLAQISQRRKQFIKNAGVAEELFADGTDSMFSPGDKEGDDQSIAKDLFR